MPGESLAGISVIIEKTNLVHCILKSAVLANQKPHEIKLETSWMSVSWSSAQLI